MEHYIGTKIISAEPMTKGQWFSESSKKGDKIELGEISKLGYKVRYPDGCESWSPKEEFEHAYRLVRPQEMALLGGGITGPYIFDEEGNASPVKMGEDCCSEQDTMSGD